jgi:hypothetical protein
MSSLLKTKDIDSLVDETQAEGTRLKRTLGPWSLIAFGIGAVIGAGIFTVTGTAAAGQHSATQSILNAPLLDLILNGSAATTLNGRPGAGPGISAVVYFGGPHLRLRGLVLRGIGFDDSHCGQRLHIRLRCVGRNLRLDHWLGSDFGVRGFEHDSGRRLFGLYQRAGE